MGSTFSAENDAIYDRAERIFWNALSFNQWVTGGFGHRQLLAQGYGYPLEEACIVAVTAVREAARLIAEDERLTPVLVPLGDGLLIAARD